MVNTRTIPIAVLLLLTIGAGPLYSGERETHQAYRVTSYTLGRGLDQGQDTHTRATGSFSPLLITGNATDILDNEFDGSVSLVEPFSGAVNTEGIAVSAEFDATDKISLHGAFGVTRNLWDPEAGISDRSSSWEANFGVIYKLIGNFSYELHFGYMDTGNLFTNRSSYTNVDSIIMISNKLTLSF